MQKYIPQKDKTWGMARGKEKNLVPSASLLLCDALTAEVILKRKEISVFKQHEERIAIHIYEWWLKCGIIQKKSQRTPLLV